MNNGKLQIILESMHRDISEIRKEQVRQGKDISSLKVWAWITRSAMASILGTFFIWVKHKLGGL